MIGYFMEDIGKGHKLFDEWSESGQLKCITTLLTYERSEGWLFWKKWHPAEKSVVDCRYDPYQKHEPHNAHSSHYFGTTPKDVEYPLPTYECANKKKCRNMAIRSQIEFQKEDYKKYSSGYDSERECLFVSLEWQNQLTERLKSQNQNSSS
jgi:hypothetical protein